MSGSVGWLRRSVAAAAVVSLVGGLVGPSASADPEEPIDCPEVMTVEEIKLELAALEAVDQPMLATGFSVAQGTEPEAFTVEVLGVLDDGIAPGRDMLIVEASGALIDDNGGGIWYGISGSPVYYGDRLIGAVAFGLSFANSPVGGLTAAEDMIEVLDYAGVGTTSSTASQPIPKEVKLDAASKRAIAEEMGTSPSAVSDSMTRLKVPFAISANRGLAKLQRTFKREGLGLFAHKAGSASSTANVDPSATLHAGDTFASTLSYGDITAAGVGTTTFVCDGMAVAFGHPFFWEGRTQMGANEGRAITIVHDSLIAYKLANVTSTVGVVDQDRLAGIRGLMGETPPLVPVTSTTTATSTGRTRDGQTDVVGSRFLPGLTFYHLFGNVDSTFDEIGEGTSAVSWTVTGETASGEEWSLERSNLYASQYDISFDSFYEITEQLSSLLDNRFEDVEFTSVDADVAVSDEYDALRLRKVLVSVGGSDFEARERVRVRPGQRIRLQTVLRPADGSDDLVSNMTLRVPLDAPRRGYVEVLGGSNVGGNFCFADHGECRRRMRGVGSFEELVTLMENAPKNNELFATLRMGRRDRTFDQAKVVLDEVVSGYEYISVNLPGSGGPKEGEEVFD